MKQRIGDCIRLHVAENQGQVLSAWLPDAQRLVQALDQLMPAAGHNLTTEAA